MVEAFLSLSRVLAVLGLPSARLARAETLASRDEHTSAFRLFAQAARAGLPRAQYRLGRCYLLGLGVPLSVREALRWLTRSAETGETAAQCQLGALALQGAVERAETGLFDDVHQGAHQQADFERAEYWCRRAAASGSAEAKALLAFILTAGPEERRDQAASEILYREAAEAGWLTGQVGAAMTFLAGWNPERRGAGGKPFAIRGSEWRCDRAPSSWRRGGERPDWTARLPGSGRQLQGCSRTRASGCTGPLRLRATEWPWRRARYVQR